MALVQAANEAEILLAQDFRYDDIRLKLSHGFEGGLFAAGLPAQTQIGCLLQPFAKGEA